MTRFPAGSRPTEVAAALLALVAAAGVVAPRWSSRRASARDAQRIEDVRRIRDAIERYHAERGVYPPARADAGRDEWDVSHEGGFLGELVEGGYLERVPLDPIDDAVHHYAYAVYAEGEYECVGVGSFYVLGVATFETEGLRARGGGYFKCSGRDWNRELAFVTGGGASYR